MQWREWATDKLRELMLPTLTICIVGSVWSIGYVREKEADIATRFSRPVVTARQLSDDADDTHEQETASTPADAGASEPTRERITSVSE